MSLPAVTRSICPFRLTIPSVEDIGQGSEPINILGIKWLPTGAAMNTIPKSAAGSMGIDPPDEDDDSAKGLQGVDGDFLNLEVAFAYRPQSVVSDKARLQGRSQHAHLLMGFYLPGTLHSPRILCFKAA